MLLYTFSKRPCDPSDEKYPQTGAIAFRGSLRVDHVLSLSCLFIAEQTFVDRLLFSRPSLLTFATNKRSCSGGFHVTTYAASSPSNLIPS